MPLESGPDFHVSRPDLRPSSSDVWFISYLPLALSDGISSPLIPLLALVLFRPSPLVVSTVIAASALSEVPFTILWGNLSDRVRHRKYFLVGSFFATGLTLVAMPFSHSFAQYFFVNVANGLATAASAPIGTMLLLETRTKRWWPRDIGLFGLISGVGTVLGLATGFLWLTILVPGTLVAARVLFAMKFLFLVAGALAFLSALTAWHWVEEPTSQMDRRSVEDLLAFSHGVVERLRGARRRVVHIVELARGNPEPIPRSEWIFLVALFVMSAGFQLFYGPLVFFLSSPAGGGLDQANIFLVFLISALASTSLFYHSGLAVEYASPKWVFLASLLARVALIPAFLTVPSALRSVPWALTLTYAGLNGLMGVTWAFLSTASTLFLVRLVGVTNKGKALGLYNALAGFGGLAGTVAGGWLYVGFGVGFTYGFAAFVVLIGALILLPIRYHRTPFAHVPLPLRVPARKRGSG
jgi:MFS family permease